MSNSLCYNVYKAVKTILSTDTTLSAYQNNNFSFIYEGYRDSNVPENLNYILMLDLVDDNEQVISLPNFPKITINIDIYCIHCNINYDVQAENLLNFIGDVKNALWNTMTSGQFALNNTCNRISFPNTNYLFYNLENYSYKSAVLRLQVEILSLPTGR